MTSIRSQKSNDLPFVWLGTWRSTYLNLRANVASKPRCENVFSDILYQPFFCTHITLEIYASSIPRKNAISRLTNLSHSEFSENWGNKPFILTQPVKEWPVFKTWNFNDMLMRYGHVKFRAEEVKWRLDDYFAYMKNNSDESPLYLFDKNFYEKMNLQTTRFGSSSYWTPECFDEDLFTLLGDQRPDFRWLIIGPERSGSTFHKDPIATSAWNAVLRGSKYWIMFPTTESFSSPPGVYVSKDESEVTSPLSIAEWLLGFHAKARKLPECVEGICREGEILYVPSGWWHLVINLEPTIAVTQNFVPKVHLSKVLAFLKDKPDQASGFSKDVADPYRLFHDRIREENPDLLDTALYEMQSHACNRKRKWDTILGNRENAQAFTFNFADIHCDEGNTNNEINE